ncbi:MAG TPA: sulfopyruvate decarboxylase subunit beta [Methanothrix sp.]|nr:sulfopyruvate decarboxylase subunit beta [Methanothrix sp.]HOK58814.1 sulfopyruvate decarboxylase subunit beta [Methanothrix sp.]HOL42804.1 sulfopyruvate decarboxylase subunit beta [Methanothrix sp.]HPO89063.1 sulfopyruvate decarboxylase subunit beta [Methanothrix sp.]
MRRIDAMAIIAEVADASNALIVCNLGYPSRELFSVRDRPENFYMLGSMGLASSIALGLSLALPERVIAIDGDGAVLMNLGTLATIASFAPPNYLLVILDNRVYGSTGCQPTCTSRCTDLAAVARGAGVRDVKVVSDEEELRMSLSGSGVVVAIVDPGNADVPVIPLSPEEILKRFMERVSPRMRRS